MWYHQFVRRIPIGLTDSQHARLGRESARRHVSVGALVREAVDTTFPEELEATQGRAPAVVRGARRVRLRPKRHLRAPRRAARRVPVVSVIVDTSALFALLDRRDAKHASAVAFWTDPDDEDLVTHAYVVVESVALVRSRLGAEAVAALVDGLLPAIRVEMVDRPLHDACLADVRRIGGASLVDRVTIAFAARHGIARAFANDADLVAAGLAPVTSGG